MASIRQQKVGSQIQRIVATVLLRDVADPRVDGLVSVTKVDVTPDLREAKVFLSVMGGKKTPATVLQGIKSAGRHIQGEVGAGLAMRFMPRLTFVLDESLKKQAEILKTIDDTMREDAKNAKAPADIAEAAEVDGGAEKDDS
jgi:ribosome-binding factor A